MNEDSVIAAFIKSRYPEMLESEEYKTYRTCAYVAYPHLKELSETLKPVMGILSNMIAEVCGAISKESEESAIDW